MNRLLTILLLAAGTACGQIDNPPTSADIADATATGRSLLTTASAAAGRGVLGGSSFGGSIFTGTSLSARPTLIASILGFSVTNNLGFDASLTNFWTATNAATAATAIGLGATNNVTFNELTATGNVTLSGVNNTMPGATNAASGSSLMTRDLLYSAQTDDNSGDLFAGFTTTSTAGAGTFAGASFVTGNVAQISTNTNSSAGVYFGDSIWSHNAFSGALMPSDKVIDLALKGVVLRVHTNTGFVMRVVFGVGTASRVPPPAGSDALSARGWGVNLFYNGSNYVYQPFWYGTNYNTAPAVALTNMSTAFSQWTGSVFTMRLRQETNGDIKFWVNNGQGSRLAATPSFQTNVVWGTNAYGGRHFAIEAASATNAAAADLVRIGYRAAYIKYEP